MIILRNLFLLDVINHRLYLVNLSISFLSIISFEDFIFFLSNQFLFHMRLVKAFFKQSFFYFDEGKENERRCQNRFQWVSFISSTMMQKICIIDLLVYKFLELGFLTIFFQELYSIFNVSQSKISNLQHFCAIFPLNHGDYNALNPAPYLTKNLYPCENISFLLILSFWIYFSIATFECPIMISPSCMHQLQAPDLSSTSSRFDHIQYI